MGIDDLLVEARAALLGHQRPRPCPACGPSVVPGTLHQPVIRRQVVRHIERCDACGIFGSDLEAALAVAAEVGAGAYYLRRRGHLERDRRFDPWVEPREPASAPEGLEVAPVTPDVVPDPEARGSFGQRT